jgi:hypothetical protein
MSYRLTKQGRENFRKWKLCSNGEFVLPSWVTEAHIDCFIGFDMVWFFIADLYCVDHNVRSDAVSVWPMLLSSELCCRQHTFPNYSY